MSASGPGPPCGGAALSISFFRFDPTSAAQSCRPATNLVSAVAARIADLRCRSAIHRHWEVRSAGLGRRCCFWFKRLLSRFATKAENSKIGRTKPLLRQWLNPRKCKTKRSVEPAFLQPDHWRHRKDDRRQNGGGLANPEERNRRDQGHKRRDGLHDIKDRCDQLFPETGFPDPYPQRQSNDDIDQG